MHENGSVPPPNSFTTERGCSVVEYASRWIWARHAITRLESGATLAALVPFKSRPSAKRSVLYLEAGPRPGRAHEAPNGRLNSAAHVHVSIRRAQQLPAGRPVTIRHMRTLYLQATFRRKRKI